jgi:hypothetical protein
MQHRAELLAVCLSAVDPGQSWRSYRRSNRPLTMAGITQIWNPARNQSMLMDHDSNDVTAYGWMAGSGSILTLLRAARRAELRGS